jgi:hypothetical protein
MRPSYQTIIGATPVPINGAWVPLSYNVLSFNAMIAGLMWPSTAAMTWLLQYTLDDPVFERPIRNASQAGTTITVSDLGGTANNSTQYGPGGLYSHGMSVGDSVILKGLGSNMDGTYDIASIVDPFTYTVTSDLTQTATASAGARVTPLRVWVHPLLTAVTTARTFAPITISQPPTVCPTIVMGVRPRISAWTSGNLDFTVLHAGMGT